MIYRHTAQWFVPALLAVASIPTMLKAQTSPEEKARLEYARMQARWKECGNAMFEGKENLSTVEKFELSGNLAADRELTPKQKDCILRVGDVLMTKELDWGERQRAVDWLGDMGHAYCMPPLLAVLRDEKEHPELRPRCAFALSHIADKRVVDPLIDAVTGPNAQVAYTAWDGLNKIVVEATDIPSPGLGRIEWRDDPKWRKETGAKYRAWWQKNRDRVKPSRTNSYHSS